MEANLAVLEQEKARKAQAREEREVSRLWLFYSQNVIAHALLHHVDDHGSITHGAGAIHVVHGPWTVARAHTHRRYESEKSARILEVSRLYDCYEA